MSAELVANFLGLAHFPTSKQLTLLAKGKHPWKKIRTKTLPWKATRDALAYNDWVGKLDKLRIEYTTAW